MEPWTGAWRDPQRKMELEDQKIIAICLEDIIHTESQLVCLKRGKLRAEEDYERQKNHLEETIKEMYYRIARVKRKAILRQKDLEWSPADDTLCEEESEKKFQTWKNFTPGDKIREHRERIGELENDEDWEPMTDIAVDRWIEEELEKHD